MKYNFANLLWSTEDLRTPLASPLPHTGSYSVRLGSTDYNHSQTKPKPSPTPQTMKDGATRYWSD